MLKCSWFNTTDPLGRLLPTWSLTLQNRGFGIGRAVVIVSYANITSLVTAIAAGVIALNESFPIDWQSILLRLMGMATLIQVCEAVEFWL